MHETAVVGRRHHWIVGLLVGMASMLGAGATSHAQYGAQPQYGAQAQYGAQVQYGAQAQYGAQPGYGVPAQVVTPASYPAATYCAPDTDVAPGTCVCPVGTSFAAQRGLCTTGRCVCPTGTTWNGAQCLTPPPPPPPQPLCRVACTAGQVCVNGVCVGNGDLRFTLMWDRPGDLDLHVVTPSGAEIFHRARTLDSGNLDRDDRTGIGPENVFWASTPPLGTYLICVEPYQIQGPTNFTLTVAQSGQAVRTLNGVRQAVQRGGACTRNSPNFVSEIVIAAPAPVQTCPPNSVYNPGTGRCECAPGSQWNGSICAMFPQPMPPTPPGPPVVPVQGRWVPAANGVMPRGAIQGGVEANGTPLYICRAAYNGGVHVGKVVGANCNFGWGGAEIAMPQYEVLVGRAGRWVGASGGIAPQGSIQGGNEANGTVLFICRASYNGGVHPGKVVGTNCNIGWGGTEMLMPQYEVLVQ